MTYESLQEQVLQIEEGEERVLATLILRWTAVN
jgi:hypothetical protein